MTEPFAMVLEVGGKTNSLGRAEEVLAAVLADASRLEELYACLSSPDAWVRMRAIDTIEKVCRVHPEWLALYIDRLNTEFAHSEQASIQWHLAQMYAEVVLTPRQKQFALRWLTERISTTSVDWIVAANAMRTLTQFAEEGAIPKPDVTRLLEVQLNHKSNAVVKRATKLLSQLQGK
jgi:hypothetical protein